MNVYQSELYHHGIKGQKWGVRRYQNPDGSLTAEGKKRYDKELQVGRERLTNRLKNTKSQVDSMQASVNKSNQRNAAQVDAMRMMIKRTLEDDVRTHAIGKKTIQLRNQAKLATAAGVGAAVVASIAAESAIPLLATPALLTAGRAYIIRTRD